MKIHQLQLVYQPEQDRILVRFNVASGEEFRLTLTRRMVKMLSPHIIQTVKQTENSSSMTSSHDGANALALERFKKQESLHLNDFHTPFRQQFLSLPIGEEPLLATTVHLTNHANGSLQFGFEEKVVGRKELRNIQVTLNEELLQGFLHLLETALTQADWGFSLGNDAKLHDGELDVAFTTDMPTKYLN
jgi:hypothetical protein